MKVALSRLLGGMLLVAGCCIGAGMLALPVLTGLAGFVPSTIALFIAWGFMIFTALLLVEINGWFTGKVNLLSMVGASLGRTGRQICWVSYLFLFYALLVAYTAASGSILSSVGSNFFGAALPPAVCSLGFALFFGVIVYFGTRPVDLINRWLMVGLIVSYLAMVALGLPKIEPSQLLYSKPSAAFLALPVLVISFGFHNIIPSLTHYMHGDLQSVRRAILGGSLLALFIYLLWTLFVLGIVPEPMLEEAYQNGEEATVSVQKILGSSVIGSFAQSFAFFAIVTSFLAQGLSLVHFIADGLKATSKSHRENGWIALCAIAPPAVLAIVYPALFFKALNFAGGICAVILFAILPILMSWIGRYKKKISSPYVAFGGKLLLVIAFAFALLIITREVIRIFQF